MSDKPQTVRRCRKCGEPEIISDLGGVRYSNLSRYTRICTVCINQLLQSEKAIQRAEKKNQKESTCCNTAARG